MIDLHNHLLPGIDDGPDTVEEAAALLSLVKKDGITTVILTPHYMPGAYDASKELITEKINQMQALDTDLRLLPGAEIYLEHSSIIHLKSGRVFTLADRGVHILVELPMGQLPHYTAHALAELRSAGFVLVLAHPERNAVLVQSPKEMEKLRSSGVLFQVDALSIIGHHGPRTREYCKRLCREGLIDFLASDAHSPGKRPPRMQEALATARTWGWDLTPMATHNPATILGEETRLEKAVPVKGRPLLARIADRFR